MFSKWRTINRGIRRAGFAVSMVVLVLAGAPVAGRSQDFSPDGMAKAYPYKDLPGVEDPTVKNEPEEKLDCSKEFRPRGLRNSRDFDLDAPGLVYRCEKDGIIIESAEPPLSRHWNPMDGR